MYKGVWVIYKPFKYNIFKTIFQPNIKLQLYSKMFNDLVLWRKERTILGLPKINLNILFGIHVSRKLCTTVSLN